MKQTGRDDRDIVPPAAGALMQSLRAFGYDVSSAIADLIDNSIAARAGRVDIRCEWNDGCPWLCIGDNGCGMTPLQLSEAMRIGSCSPLEPRAAHDLGRYGLGLKSASLSQCRRLTVASRTHGEDPDIRCWDLDVITAENDFVLLRSATPDAVRCIEEHFLNAPSGTLVMWEKLDRMLPEGHAGDAVYQSVFIEQAAAVGRHIAMTFSDYMLGTEQMRFTLNGMPVEPWDPCAFDHPLTTQLPEEILHADGHEVRVRAVILPHRSRLGTAEYMQLGGSRGWIAQQGFYIYRCRRLLVAGGWLFTDLESLEQYRMARIRIDIGNACDSAWSLDVRKTAAVPPACIRGELRRIARAARARSAQIFRHRGSRLPKQGRRAEQIYVWGRQEHDGRLGYRINRDHPLLKDMLRHDHDGSIARVLRLIEETVPVPLIIADHCERAEDMLRPCENAVPGDYEAMLRALYGTYVGMGCTPQEAVECIAGSEPFMYAPELVELFCERVGISRD